MIRGRIEDSDFQYNAGVVVTDDKHLERLLEGLEDSVYNPNTGEYKHVSIGDGDMEAYLLICALSPYFRVEIFEGPEILQVPEGEGITA